MTLSKARKLTVLFFMLSVMMGLFGSVLEAQPPPQSDVQPEDTREAWERTDYGSGPDRRPDTERVGFRCAGNVGIAEWRYRGSTSARAYLLDHPMEHHRNERAGIRCIEDTFGRHVWVLGRRQAKLGYRPRRDSSEVRVK